MTGRDIANPLASVLARACKALPAATGVVAEHRRRVTEGVGTVIVADHSSSMADKAGASRKIDVLRDALDGVLRAIHAARLIGFASLPGEIGRGERFPEPGGSTALHLALTAALAMRPTRLVVISDGAPDDAAAALRAVEDFPGTIDTIFCGSDSDVGAIRFMQSLARRGRGEAVVRDLATGSTAIEQDVRRLALPRR